jgi:Transposase DDE domain
VWVQPYDHDHGEVRWRDHKNVPPSALRIASPDDLEVRYSEKRGQHWRGYTVHLTETCDTEAPHVITHVETTLATDHDVTAVDTIHHGLADKALRPEVHLVDGAYVSSDGLVASQHDYHVTLTGPMRQDQSWQAHDDQGFDISQFRIHWDQEMVTCPTGHQSRYWKPATGPRGKPTIQVLFDKKTCAGCAVRTQCPRSKAGPRELTLHPQAQHLALQAARARQHTDTFKELYRSRAGVEGTISQAVFASGMRRTR